MRFTAKTIKELDASGEWISFIPETYRVLGPRPVVRLRSPFEPGGRGSLAAVNGWREPSTILRVPAPFVQVCYQTESKQGGVAILATMEMLKDRLISTIPMYGRDPVQRTIEFVGMTSQKQFRRIRWAFDSTH